MIHAMVKAPGLTAAKLIGSVLAISDTITLLPLGYTVPGFLTLKLEEAAAAA